jgi:hypothetical protein
MPQENKQDNTKSNNTKQLQDRKAMEESDNELTKALFASPVTLPPIHSPKKCVQRNKPELLHRQRRTAIKGNQMEENNLKLKETSKKIKETKKTAKKMEDIFGTYSGEWGNYVDLEENYM